MTLRFQQCGAQVTEQYPRVSGDENNAAHRCLAYDRRDQM